MSQKCTTYNVRSHTRTYSSGKSVTVRAHARTICTPSGVEKPPAESPINKPANNNIEDYGGKNIKDICEIGYHKEEKEDGHCAHFVSHVLGYSFGATCKGINWDTKQKAAKLNHKGATIRVVDLFKKCPKVGMWGDRDVNITGCLVFIIDRKFVDLERKTMVDVRQKHVGIYHNDMIWHYSNSKNKVVSQTPDKFSKHYGSNSKYILIYGTFPPQ